MPWEKDDSIEKVNGGQKFGVNNRVTPELMNALVQLLFSLEET